MKKSLLVISFSDLATDPRVARQLDSLNGDYAITTCGFGAPLRPVERHIRVDATPRPLALKLLAAARLLLRAFDQAYWSHPLVTRALALLEGGRFDAVLANEPIALPLALRVARGAPVIFDAHEYSPEELSDSWRWRLLFRRYTRFLCSTYLPRARACMTVCDSIAQAYEREFGVKMAVIDNASPYWELEPRPTTWPIRMIYHGAAMPVRRLETTIEMMRHVDERFQLDFMLMPDPGGAYLARLKALAAGNPRIAFRDPVAPLRIVPESTHYDIGLFLLEPVNFNYEHALPNKIFEFIQARLAVAIGPSPEMARLVRRYDCGVVAPSFEPRAMAAALNALTPAEIDRLKANAHRAAKVHHAGENAARLRAIASSVLA